MCKNELQSICCGTLGRIFFAALISVLSSAVRAGWLEPVEPATKPPVIKLSDLNGVEHSLGAMKGKVVLVNFWTTWCPPCIQEMPSLVSLANRFESDKLIVLAVNVQEKQPRVKRMASRLALDFPVLLDHSREVASAWGVKVFPSSFLLDSKGSLRFRVIGPIEWDSDEVLTVVEQLLAE